MSRGSAAIVFLALAVVSLVATFYFLSGLSERDTRKEMPALEKENKDPR